MALAAASSDCNRGRATHVQVLASSLPERLDPYMDTRLSSVNFFGNVFEPLVWVEPDSRITAGLAESWSNPGPEVYELKIRPNVRFHDGTPLTATDVVASLERARSPSFPSAGALGDVGRISTGGLDRVLIHTRRDVDNLLGSLAAVSITKPAKSGVFVGTGPYRVAAFESARHAELQRFEDYYGPKPEIEKAVFQAFDGEEEALRGFAREPSTIVFDPPRALVHKASLDHRFRVVSMLGSSLTYLALNVAHEGPFRDVRARRALRLALDPLELVTRATPAGGVVATQFVPQGVFGSDPSLREPHRDVAAARAFLAEAGYPDNFAIELEASPANKELQDLVVKQASEAGALPAPRLSLRGVPQAQSRARARPFCTAGWWGWSRARRSGTSSTRRTSERAMAFETGRAIRTPPWTARSRKHSSRPVRPTASST